MAKEDTDPTKEVVVLRWAFRGIDCFYHAFIQQSSCRFIPFFNALGLELLLKAYLLAERSAEFETLDKTKKLVAIDSLARKLGHSLQELLRISADPSLQGLLSEKIDDYTGLEVVKALEAAYEECRYPVPHPFDERYPLQNENGRKIEHSYSDLLSSSALTHFCYHASREVLRLMKSKHGILMPLWYLKRRTPDDAGRRFRNLFFDGQILDLTPKDPDSSEDRGGEINEDPPASAAEPRMSRLRSILLWITGLALPWKGILEILTLLIITGQLLVMQGQLEIMGAAIRQTAATIETAKVGNAIAAQSLQMSDRPWVSLKEFGKHRIRAERPLAITSQIRNEGKGPAFDVRLNFAGNVAPADRVYLPELGMGSLPRLMLFPGEQIQFRSSIDGNLLTKEKVAGIKSGKDALMLFGRVDYTDSMGGQHQTRLCMHYSADLKSFVSCPVGNAAD